MPTGPRYSDKDVLLRRSAYSFSLYFPSLWNHKVEPWTAQKFVTPKATKCKRKYL